MAEDTKPEAAKRPRRRAPAKAKAKRPRRPRMGLTVQYRHRDRWLPFVITDIHLNDVVSGVAITGNPAGLGLANPTQAHAAVPKGINPGEWQFLEDEDEG